MEAHTPRRDGYHFNAAEVTEATPEYIILDGTYFYPEGGGQPPDHGTIEWDGGHAAVRDVRKDHGEVRHYADALEGEPPAAGTTVEGRIDEKRRRRLTRMHTAQHVVSRVVLDSFDATTAGNQVHADRSRIDFEPADFDADDIAAIQQRANEAIERDLAVRKANRARDAVEERVDEGRALLDLIPDHVDPLRVVEIEDFDMCPCGGTHVSSLGEIGRIEVVDCTSKGAQIDRVEFELRESSYCL